MKKHRLFSVVVFAAFLTASMFTTACKGPNNPKPPTQTLKTEEFPKAPEGKTYSGYKITWIDAQGNAQTKEVTIEEIKNGIVLPGGLKEGTKPTITGIEADTNKPETPANTEWKPIIQAGIDELSKDKPDYDAALAKFKEAYSADKNNTTKAYYAATQLAYISVKPATVNFMKDKMGFATYPATLNALVNLEWFKKYTEKYTNPDGTTHEFTYLLPEMKPAADWYKDMFPPLQIPAYIIEHSNSANNVDQLLDELYGILFGTEFTEASSVLNSLDASQPVTIDKQLIKALGLSGENAIFPGDSDVALQKDQLLGVIGGLTVTKGVFEFLQSYSFNTDLNILKWNWDDDNEILKTLGEYNANQDPFNNGFLKGRSSSKIAEAKTDIVKGADLLLAAYKSLTDSDTLPADAKAKLKKHTDYIQAIVKEIRDAIVDGRKANIFIGENNLLKGDLTIPKDDPSNPGHWIFIPMTTFEIDMGKVFTYEYFKLSNLFEMNGLKPKIYPADSAHSYQYMKFTLSKFLNDFATMKWEDGTEGLEDVVMPLNNAAGAKIINFYK